MHHVIILILDLAIFNSIKYHSHLHLTKWEMIK